jgi:hypothetical protein
MSIGSWVIYKGSRFTVEYFMGSTVVISQWIGNKYSEISVNRNEITKG